MAELKVVTAHIRDLRRIVCGLGILREQRAHLRLVLDVKLIGLKLHARGVGYGFLHLDAHEHVLIIRVLFLKVVRVVGKRKGYAGFAVEPQQPLGGAVLDLKAVVLYLKIKALRPEKLVKLKGFFLRALVVSRSQHPRYRSGGAAGKADKPRRVLMQQLPVDARLYIEALGEGRGHKITQVLIALLVSAQKDEVGVFRVDAVLLAEALTRRDIDLAADNGLYPLGAAGLVKRDGAVHNAVVGYRDGALPQLLYALYQPLDAAGAVEQRILGMNMKMHKTHFFPFVATLHIIFISGARPVTVEAIVFALARFSLSSRSFKQSLLRQIGRFICQKLFEPVAQAAFGHRRI